jgi:DNA-binding NtrC family response regulator
VGRAVASMLENRNYRIVRADDARRGAEHLAKDQFDVVVIEVRHSTDDHGLNLLRHVNDTAPHLGPRIVVIASDPSPALQQQLDDIGICDLVLKPVHDTEILRAIQECLDRSSATVH